MRVLQLDTPRRDAELAADRLWAAGARAVEEVELGASRIGLRTVIAADDAVSLERLGSLPDGWVIGWVEADDEPARTWRSFARPVEVGSELVLRPAWCRTVGDGRLEIAIEPGGSFGLGDHPTTRLSAAATLRVVRAGDDVLDVGCGSGVLGIVAARRDARRVVGIDIAEAAVEATLDNAARNGVAGTVTASSTPIEALDGSFDVVLANVLAPTLIAMAPDLHRLLADDGVLVVSGILAARHEHVVEALEPLRVVRVDTLDSWAAIELRR
jgi:ribosomal protein L11 methyltransferase